MPAHTRYSHPLMMRTTKIRGRQPLVNIFKQLGIPASYGQSPSLQRFDEPEILVDAGPNVMGRPQRLTPETNQAWKEMTTAAAADSIELLLVSGYRSIEDQASLIWNKLCEGQPIDAILKVNTAPGFSQHHSGRAIDITTPSVRPLTEPFDESPAFQWLEKNAVRFGFVQPYGKNNDQDLSYEPWHWFFAQK